MSTFTPGPWRLRMHPAEPAIERPEYPDSVVDANGKSVVFACVTMTASREGEWLANARLIAAAPDHHAVARELDRLCLVIESAVRNADTPGNHHDVLALIKANRAAIAKAEGLT